VSPLGRKVPRAIRSARLREYPKESLPLNQRGQRESAASMSSTSSSSRQPAFVGQAVFHDAANRLQKKPSTSSPAQASSPATTALDASTSGTDPDKKVTLSSEAALGTVHCKYSGCSRLAKYRKKRDTTPIACQAHKRK
ncbi:unnamed protein product, partial [Scytosiphon promiscuus]